VQAIKAGVDCQKINAGKTPKDDKTHKKGEVAALYSVFSDEVL